jgi:tetratricopeptide (TPR) repeat protein
MALWLLATIGQQEGDFGKAVDAFSAALKAYPGNGPILAGRAEAYRELRKYDLAFADTEAALRTGYAPPSLRLLRINILLQKGDLAATAEEIDQLVKDSPTSDFALVAAGKAYQAIGMNQKAMASFDRAIAIKPLSYIYINRAQARPYADTAGKLADLDAALKLEPDQEDALAVKAELLSRLGRHEQAIALYDRAIQVALEPSSLKRDRAIALARAGRVQEATKELDAQRAKAKTAADLASLCWAEAINDVLLESAVQDCREALRRDPHYPSATEDLAMALLKSGKLPEALAKYNEALAQQPNASDYMGRAFVYARMHDATHARADADRALALRPDVDSEFADYGLVLDKEVPRTAH